MPEVECQTIDVFVFPKHALDAEIRLPFRSLLELYDKDSKDKAEEIKDRKQCDRCKVFLTHDKYKKRKNGELHHCCIICNDKKMVYVRKCRPPKTKSEHVEPVQDEQTEK